jgi:hypothetical protein
VSQPPLMGSPSLATTRPAGSKISRPGSKRAENPGGKTTSSRPAPDAALPVGSVFSQATRGSCGSPVKVAPRSPTPAHNSGIGFTAGSRIGTPLGFRDGSGEEQAPTNSANSSTAHLAPDLLDRQGRGIGAERSVIRLLSRVHPTSTSCLCSFTMSSRPPRTRASRRLMSSVIGALTNGRAPSRGSWTKLLPRWTARRGPSMSAMQPMPATARTTDVMRVAGLLLALLLAAGCASASPSPSPSPSSRVHLGISNGTTLDVTLVVNGQRVADYPARGAHPSIDDAPLPALPWEVEALSPSGRVLTSMHVDAGEVQARTFPARLPSTPSPSGESTSLVAASQSGQATFRRQVPRRHPHPARPATAPRS